MAVQFSKLRQIWLDWHCKGKTTDVSKFEILEFEIVSVKFWNSNDNGVKNDDGIGRREEMGLIMTWFVSLVDKGWSASVDFNSVVADSKSSSVEPIEDVWREGVGSSSVELIIALARDLVMTGIENLLFIVTPTL
jgi:hypothetical protein